MTIHAECLKRNLPSLATKLFPFFLLRNTAGRFEFEAKNASPFFED
jgi:hypothetical protein